jgi:hypothetical protein
MPLYPLNSNRILTVDEYIDHRIEELEKIVSTADYKRGVEDATKPMTLDDPVYNDKNLTCFTTFDWTNTYLAARRKKLLTKKVTKWVNIYDDEQGTAYHYPSQEAARYAACPGSTIVQNYRGTFPIEIEVPL